MIYLIRQPINIGSTPNDGNGDTVRSAFNKVNINEAVLFDNQISLLNTANSVFITANAAFNAANPNTINSIFVTANAAYNASNPNTINSIFFTVNAAFDRANTSLSASDPNTINTIFITTNSAFDKANAAFNIANTGNTQGSNGYFSIPVSIANTQNPGYGLYVDWRNTSFNAVRATSNQSSAVWGESYGPGAGITGKEYTYGAIGHLAKDGYGVYTPNKSYFGDTLSVANTQNPGYGLYVDWKNTSWIGVYATSNQSSAIWGESYGAGAGITGKEYTYGAIGHLGKNGYGVYTPNKSYFGDSISVANTANPGYGLFVDWSGSSWNGIRVKSNQSAAVWGQSIGSGGGVVGQDSNNSTMGILAYNGFGVYTSNTAYFGNTICVCNTVTPGPYGIYVDKRNSSWIGVYSTSRDSSAIWGECYGTGAGVSGQENTTGAIGHLGLNGYGVYTPNKSYFGDAIGVRTPPSGYGLYVDWSNTSWNAIRAKSNQSSAVWGESIGSGGGIAGKDSSGAVGVLGYSGYGVWTGNNMYCGGSLTQSSDKRLKENVNDLSGALKIIQQMRPVSFDWKPETIKGSKHDFGLIAQEVEKIVPEIVQEVTIPDFTEEDNLEKSLGTIKSVDYIKIVPFLIAALQELKEEFEEYKKTHP